MYILCAFSAFIQLTDVFTSGFDLSGHKYNTLRGYSTILIPWYQYQVLIQYNCCFNKLHYLFWGEKRTGNHFIFCLKQQHILLNLNVECKYFQEYNFIELVFAGKWWTGRRKKMHSCYFVNLVAQVSFRVSLKSSLHVAILPFMVILVSPFPALSHTMGASPHIHAQHAEWS